MNLRTDAKAATLLCMPYFAPCFREHDRMIASVAKITSSRSLDGLPAARACVYTPDLAIRPHEGGHRNRCEAFVRVLEIATLMQLKIDVGDYEFGVLRSMGERIFRQHRSSPLAAACNIAGKQFLVHASLNIAW